MGLDDGGRVTGRDSADGLQRLRELPGRLISVFRPGGCALQRVQAIAYTAFDARLFTY